jgi:hypothetical protein
MPAPRRRSSAFCPHSSGERRISILVSSKPDALRAKIGGNVLGVRSRGATSLGERIAESLGSERLVRRGADRQPEAHNVVARDFANVMASVSSGNASTRLEIRFISKAGRRLSEEGEAA